MDYYMWSWLSINQPIFFIVIIAHAQQTGAAGGFGGGLVHVKLVINQSTQFFPHMLSLRMCSRPALTKGPGGGPVHVELVINQSTNFFPLLSLRMRSKPALLEGLEVDQYMWSVVQNPLCQDADEVQIDGQANMKPFSIKVGQEEIVSI
jgi:hypothetical protein